MVKQRVNPAQQNNVPITGTNSGAGGGTTNYIILGGLKICWGTTAVTTIPGGGAANRAVNFPVTYTTPPQVVASSDTSTGAWSDWIINTAQSIVTTGFLLQHHNMGSGTSSGTVGNWMAIGV